MIGLASPPEEEKVGEDVILVSRQDDLQSAAVNKNKDLI